MGDGAGSRSAASSVPASRPDSYRRSVGSPRGEARRDDLLMRVTDELLIHGLTDFSLRRVARATGTTHKVLLYHFDSAEDLLAQAVNQLRARRISGGLAAALEAPERIADGTGPAHLAGPRRRRGRSVGPGDGPGHV